MAAGRIFHWKHGWIPLAGTSTDSPEEKHAAQMARLAASRARNAERDAAKRERLAASRAKNAERDAAKRERYRAAAQRHLDRKTAHLPSASDVPPIGS